MQPSHQAINEASPAWNEYINTLCKASADLNLFARDEKYRAEQESFPEQHIDIDKAVRVFYALIHLEAKEETNGLRLTSFQTYYNDKLASAIFDYCVGSICGELRHALDLLTGRYKIRFSHSALGEDTHHVNRKSAISASLHFNPSALLKTAFRLFSLPGWGGGFGGEPWANIAKTTLRKGVVSNLRWIDEIVHCRHCGGTLFDRSIIFLHENTSPFIYNGAYMNFRDFLDFRQSGQYEDVLDGAGYTYNHLLEEYGDVIDAVLNYKPVNFGFIEFDADVKERDDKPGQACKTQKQINQKPFQNVPTCFDLAPSLKVYISSKYNHAQKAELMKIFTEGKDYILKVPLRELPWTQKIIRVYFLYPYISKGKTYLRKASILTNRTLAGKKIREKLFNQVLKNTSDANKIKIYIDKVD